MIPNLFAATGSNFFCANCNKGFHRIEQYKCKRTCECCFVTPPCRSDGAEMIECVDCGRKFFGHSCFVNHKSAGSYKNNGKVCDVVRLCENCLKIVNTQHGQHECGISFCKQCSKRLAFNDACFMQFVGGGKNLKAEKKFLYIFYDFETRQNTSYGENARIHMPNICVAHQVCTDCIDVDDLKIICSKCGVREFIFTEDLVKQLMNLCIRESAQREGF